jgi:hypothetical protein
LQNPKTHGSQSFFNVEKKKVQKIQYIDLRVLINSLLMFKVLASVFALNKALRKNTGAMATLGHSCLSFLL